VSPPLRIFAATGEASGDMLAATLADAIREFAPDAAFSGVGGDRMAAAGFTLVTRTTGWASLGPLAALRRIPPLVLDVFRHALALRRDPVDLVVLIDFGAYNVRFARVLRALGYVGPVLYYFPPGAWLDSAEKARLVAGNALPLTAFAHQRDFYTGLGLPIAWFGHPLGSLVAPRAPRAATPPDGGTVALLPGSRRGEIERHLPLLLRASELVRARRPHARFSLAVADDEGAGHVTRVLAAHPGMPPPALVRGARVALDAADAAWIASGTAVLEATLREVPTVALYTLSPAQAAIGRRVWLDRHPYITLPNILLGREIVPELLQERCTPELLATSLEAVLAAPAAQLAGMREVRRTLGPPDALRRCAAFAVAAARAGRAA